MKSYPSIDRVPRLNQEVFAFDKLDGSNIRAEWSRKRGFYKFGSKTHLIDAQYPVLGESVSLIQEKYEDDLGKIFTQQRYERAICFFEFCGPNSFAGSHAIEQHDVTLFDVCPYKKGILLPLDFLSLFGDLEHPKLLYRGKCTDEFVESVKTGILEGMTFEGVVCKTSRGNQKLPLMFKIKNRAWIEKLKAICTSEEQFNALV